MKKFKNVVLGLAVALMGTACNSTEKPAANGNQNEPQQEQQNEKSNADCVDLGLPSGKIWATCNLGANTPEEYGTYFAWGEVEPKKEYEWTNYKLGNGETDSKIKMTKYCSHSKRGEVDNLLQLEAADDAAATLSAGKWRIPTKEEWEELLDGCTWEWVKNYNGKGFDMKKGTSKTNGNTILFPFSGYYNGTAFIKDEIEFWTANQKADNGLEAYYVRMLTHNQSTKNGLRKQGMPIRAVANK